MNAPTPQPDRPAEPGDPARPLISLAIDPRVHLLLFEIADDPTYAALEIQRFADDIHGTGFLVLLQRHDGTVDVHHDPALRLERNAFSIGRGIGTWRATTIAPAELEIHPDGAHARVSLEDGEGRRIEVRIDDRDGRPRRRGTLLAPVGAAVERPRQLFLVVMRDFDLGRTSGPAELAIGGEPRTITPFPGPAWLHGRRFIRYAGNPVIAVLNPEHDGPIDPRSLGPVDVVEEVQAADGARATLRFAPPIPDLRALADGAAVDGGWTLDAADEPGLTGGTWMARRAGDRVTLEMAVTRPWRPRDLPRSLRFVTTVARVFRDWPTTYRWRADIDLASDPPHATSGWTRTTG